VSILGIPVTQMDFADILQHISSYLDASNLVEARKPLMIITLNSEMAGLAIGDHEFDNAVAAASLIVPDGIGIILASKILGTPLQSRICGIDLGEQLFEMAVDRSFTVYLLGATEEVIQGACENLFFRLPELRIVGAHHGYFDSVEEKQILSEIRLKRPHILLVGLGTPKQEKWLANHLRELPPCVCMGVGGSFDVWSGMVSRAPDWVRRIGLEWLYRIIRQPKRIFRTFSLIRFAGRVVVKGLYRLFGGSK
jgi:N-acetylglucosaminyldiphosphoundecaprenol N-acetyl-beta-D-mannosaminyltransferase